MSAPALILPTTQSKGQLDRFLSLFAEVRPGEGIGALLLAANVFLLLAAYYILKTVREALILTEGGAEIKAYSSAGQALLLLLIIPAYGVLASKVKRDRLITFVTLFFASHIILFYLAGVWGFRVGILFFLWVGIFNLLVIAQFWAFANDHYAKEQGSRLFAIVGIGSSLGAWVGSVQAGRLFPIFGTYGLMLVACGLLLLCVVVKRLLNSFPRAFNKNSLTIGEQPLKKTGAFRLIRNSRYLFWIAMLMVLVNVVNTTGEFILGKLVVENADRMIAGGTVSATQKPEIIGAFYGSFFSWVNLAGMLFQLFLVSRIFKYIGIRGALFILPTIALGGYAFAAVIPLLPILRSVKILENGTDYSIQNTARHALFLRTSREAKYKAKAAIDSFFWRAGDVLAAALVFAGTQLAFTTRAYASINAVLVLLWIAVVVIITREHRKLSSDAEELA